MTDLHQFIWEHREEDLMQLALSAKKYPNLPMAYIARQIAALRKLRHKIPSWYREGLDFPVPVSVEQASSEATAQFKASLFSGACMADLTGGLGVDATFFARAFHKVFYVEKISEISAAARHNMGVLGIENVHFIQDDAENFLKNSTQQFDLLYLDPARRDDRKGKVFQFADCSPNALAIKDLMLQYTPGVLLKTAPFLDIYLAAKQLKNVSKIWVLEYEDDCREVLYLLERQAPELAKIPIHAVMLAPSGTAKNTFLFSFQEEQDAVATFGLPSGFLYEPSPALMKAGAFKSYAKRFGLHKLHPNTHLYCAEQFVPNVPGRVFRIADVCQYDKKAVATAVPSGKANITTRNFPESTETVRKKLALRDGGDTYLFAATDCVGKKVVLVCSKI